jgi:aspartate-semialdehyde dehydrogenase
LKALEELQVQVKDLAAGNPVSQRKVYPHQIAFNVLPHIDVFMPNGYTKEEMKMVNETKKIMGDDSIAVTATTVRVPVAYGHSESVNIETGKKISAGEVRELLSNAPGIAVVDDPSRNMYPLPINAEGRDDVFVGRIREDESISNGINMWIVSDNIRKGAALNAVQIAELLIAKKML